MVSVLNFHNYLSFIYLLIFVETECHFVALASVEFLV